MKALLITALGMIILVIMAALSSNKTIEEKVELQLEESAILQDTVLIYLKELHDKNDTLLVKHFGR